jgi:hypothetical protein
MRPSVDAPLLPKSIKIAEAEQDPATLPWKADDISWRASEAGGGSASKRRAAFGHVRISEIGDEPHSKFDSHRNRELFYSKKGVARDVPLSFRMLIFMGFGSPSIIGRIYRATLTLGYLCFGSLELYFFYFPDRLTATVYPTPAPTPQSKMIDCNTTTGAIDYSTFYLVLWISLCIEGIANLRFGSWYFTHRQDEFMQVIHQHQSLLNRAAIAAWVIWIVVIGVTSAYTTPTLTQFATTKRVLNRQGESTALSSQQVLQHFLRLTTVTWFDLLQGLIEDLPVNFLSAAAYVQILVLCYTWVLHCIYTRGESVRLV